MFLETINSPVKNYKRLDILNGLNASTQEKVDQWTVLGLT